MIKRTTLREIRQSFGRFFAIFSIIALGVGFFSGLKVSKQVMVHTGDRYLSKMQLFDLRLISTIGFEEADIEAFSSMEEVRTVAGAYSADILYQSASGNESVLKAHSITEGVNGLKLVAGRMPEQAGECVVDSNLFTEEQIGTKIVLSDANQEETLKQFAFQEYEITGIADSSYYINFERGNTSLGSGRISGFLYLLPEGFTNDYYTELFIKFHSDFPIYSEEYNAYINEKQNQWEEICQQQVILRYHSLVSEATKKLEDAKNEFQQQKASGEEKLNEALKQLEQADQEITEGEEQLKKAWEMINSSTAELKEKETASVQKVLKQQELEETKAQLEQRQKELDAAKQKASDGWNEYETQLTEYQQKIADAEEELDYAKKELDAFTPPETYVLDRNTNVGYVCFENDSDIVEGIADVFPIFFFLVAALVCSTTMNRMVEEQRVQIGVLKALGYNNQTIMGKYMFYSGSAAILGCIFGFFAGTIVFPTVIWQAYHIMYRMPELEYVFQPKLAIISFMVSLICSVGTTWLSCRYELRETSANLLRPKAPKAGKRIFLERIPWIWKRMKFLHKVTIRNLFRYKKRFLMMVIGISGCTALLVTGFGIKDSIANVAAQQYEEIQIYDGAVGFQKAQNPGISSDFTAAVERLEVQYTFAAEKNIDLLYQEKSKAVNLIVLEKAGIADQFINLHRTDGSIIPYPEPGTCVISNNLAETFQISEGDTIRLRDDTLREIEVTVSGIFENFVYHYIYLSSDTYYSKFRETPEYKTAYINVSKNQEVHQAAAEFMQLEGVSSVTVNADMKERIGTMMDSLNYIVLLVIACAAFLAFIVLYNLTNINITERIREIATIKVLGFYKKETASYVFRENIVLTAIGGILGLFLGRYLHAFVMAQIKIDLVSFDVHIAGLSYFFSIILTFAFAIIIHKGMSGKLDRIPMAESLKSVD